LVRVFQCLLRGLPIEHFILVRPISAVDLAASEFRRWIYRILWILGGRAVNHAVDQTDEQASSHDVAQRDWNKILQQSNP